MEFFQSSIGRRCWRGPVPARRPGRGSCDIRSSLRRRVKTAIPFWTLPGTTRSDAVARTLRMNATIFHASSSDESGRGHHRAGDAILDYIEDCGLAHAEIAAVRIQRRRTVPFAAVGSVAAGACPVVEDAACLRHRGESPSGLVGFLGCALEAQRPPARAHIGAKNVSSVAPCCSRHPHRLACRNRDGLRWHGLRQFALKTQPRVQLDQARASRAREAPERGAVQGCREAGEVRVIQEIERVCRAVAASISR